MAFKVADRVHETTTTTGTGSVSLAGAAANCQAFASVMSNGDQCYYCIAGQTGTQWECGIGTYTTSGNALARTTLISSSTGSAVSFSAGTKDVFLTVLGERVQQSTLEVLTSSMCISDASLAAGASTAGVTDNTASLQAILDLATTYGKLKVIWDGCYGTQLLTVHNNTEIVASEGCGAIELPNFTSSEYAGAIFVNDTPVGTPNTNITINGGIWNGNRNGAATGGTATITGTISGSVLTVTAVTSGTIVNGAYVYGAGITTSPIPTIVSLGTGTGGVGTYNLSASFTISSETIYCSTDLANYAHPRTNRAGKATGMFVFFNVDRLTLQSLTLVDSSEFNIWLSNVTNYIVHDIMFKATANAPNTDGIHINKGKYGTVERIFGYTYDDFVAINADDGFYGSGAPYTPTGAVLGDITDLTVRDLFPNNALNAVRMLSCTSAIDRVLIDGIYGSTQGALIYANNYPNGGTESPPGGGNFGNVVISNVNCNCNAAGGYDGAHCTFGGNWQSLTMLNWSRVAGFSDGQLFCQFGKSGNGTSGKSQGIVAGSIIVNGYTSLDTSTQTAPHFQWGGGNITDLSLVNIRVQRQNTRAIDCPVLTLNSTGYLQFLRLQNVLSTFNTHVVEHLGGTVCSVAMNNIHHQGVIGSGTLSFTNSAVVNLVDVGQYFGPLAYQTAGGASITTTRGCDYTATDTLLQQAASTYNDSKWLSWGFAGTGSTDITGYNPEVGPKWTHSPGDTGTWTWDTANMVSDSLSGGCSAQVDTGQNNYVMRVTNWSCPASNYTQFYLRITSGSRLVVFHISTSQIQFYDIGGLGGPTNQSISISASTHNVKFTASGTTITCQIDGGTVYSFTSSFSTGSSVGIGTAFSTVSKVQEIALTLS